MYIHIYMFTYIHIYASLYLYTCIRYWKYCTFVSQHLCYRGPPQSCTLPKFQAQSKAARTRYGPIFRAAAGSEKIVVDCSGQYNILASKYSIPFAAMDIHSNVKQSTALSPPQSCKKPTFTKKGRILFVCICMFLHTHTCTQMFV